MKEEVLGKVGIQDKANQDVRPRMYIFSFKKFLDTAKAVVMIPTYFLLMSGLKVLDKKDKLQKNERKRYYF